MPFQRISSAEFHALQKQGDVTLIDIRDPHAFKTGHIEGAVHVDDGNVEEFVKTADKAKPLVVCCYHGNSSQGAAEYMSEQGFQRTYSLDGGYAGYKPLP